MPSQRAGDLANGFASGHDLLGLVVEGDFLAGLHGGDAHAKRDGVAVARFNAGVWRFAGADALHPVAHVGGGLGIGAGVGGGFGCDAFAESEAGQEVGLHLHLVGLLLLETAFGRDLLGVHV